jgi:hypothetical protein
MPSPLQKTPTGLLGAFDLKTLGVNPTAFGDTVVPISDVSDMYFLGNQRATGTSNTAVTAPALAVVTLVPAGEVWRVKAVGFSVARNAADVALTPYVGLRVRRVAGISVQFHSQTLPAVVAADLVQFGGIWLDHPLWMRPGDALILSNATTFSMNASFNLAIDFELFPQ